ncbi:MAG: B12-binding domain-containing radical SAM protein [Deltaproteobacteria bacterium]|nr:B12-binding domain-containing radical SAM protein [Deltaproteobacteria bacterium]MBW2140344.1 B12-binding domain-containing radical SAM protein [Deltaproteobacteria bacterium]
MKVLLVYPRIPDTFWSFSNVLNFVRRKAVMPPLGLLTVAALCPQDWEFRLKDLNVTQLKDKDIEWADMVFLSAMIVQREGTDQVINQVKTVGRPLVAGGPLFTSLADEFEHVDHLVLGEAEETLPLFLADLKRGQPAPVYHPNSRPSIKSTPSPRWDLIERKKDYQTMPIQFSRGCPFDCEFCDITLLFGRKPRTKDPDQLITEIENLYQDGWRGSVFVVDDNFIGPKKETMKFLSALSSWQKKRGNPFVLNTEASVNLADDQELMDLMTEAGFNTVFLGIETPEEESLAECGKKQNQHRNLVEAVQTLQRNGLEVTGGFIVGFDNDPPDIFDRQIRFIQESGVVTAMVGILSALPGTKLYQRLMKEGRILKESSGNNCETGALNFVPAMDREKLLAGYRKVVNTIYEPQVYYDRIKVFLNNYNPKKKQRLKPMQIYAFFMALWYLGVRDSRYTKRYFWRLVINTIFRQPSLLTEAITHAVYGLHFRKVAQNQ